MSAAPCVCPLFPWGRVISVVDTCCRASFRRRYGPGRKGRGLAGVATSPAPLEPGAALGTPGPVSSCAVGNILEEIGIATQCLILSVAESVKRKRPSLNSSIILLSSRPVPVAPPFPPFKFGCRDCCRCRMASLEPPESRATFVQWFKSCFPGKAPREPPPQKSYFPPEGFSPNQPSPPAAQREPSAKGSRILSATDLEMPKAPRKSVVKSTTRPSRVKQKTKSVVTLAFRHIDIWTGMSEDTTQASHGTGISRPATLGMAVPKRRSGRNSSTRCSTASSSVGLLVLHPHPLSQCPWCSYYRRGG